METIEVTSLEDPRLDAYARLTEAQLRNKLEPQKGIFIAESPKVIKRALDAGTKALSLLAAHEHRNEALALAEQAELAQGSSIEVFCGDRAVLAQLTGFELTRGVLCAMRRPTLPSPASLLANASLVAVLDGIVDHTNVGAIFRSAAALGVDAVLASPTCCDPLYRRAVRVSMGTVFQVPWTRLGASVSDWPDAGMAVLSEAGFTTAALALVPDAVPLDAPQLRSARKLALVMGTEGDGLSARTIAHCDMSVVIPMQHGVDSLNVAAASAVAFWELRRANRGS